MLHLIKYSAIHLKHISMGEARKSASFGSFNSIGDCVYKKGGYIIGLHCYYIFMFVCSFVSRDE